VRDGDGDGGWKVLRGEGVGDERYEVQMSKNCEIVIRELDFFRLFFSKNYV